MIPFSGSPPWAPDHPRTLPRIGVPTPRHGASPPLAIAGLWHAIPSRRLAPHRRAAWASAMCAHQPYASGSSPILRPPPGRFRRPPPSALRFPHLGSDDRLSALRDLSVVLVLDQNLLLPTRAQFLDREHPVLERVHHPGECAREAAGLN